VFTSPLGLLALLGVPLVIALHMFRRRFSPREVSALFLWDLEDPTAAAGRKRQRLMRSPSFWCELIAALLLGLALGGPRSCGASSAEHLVVLLDSSASMSAVGAAGTDGEVSFAERARELALERLEDLPAGSRISLIASGAEPRVLAGPLALPAEAAAALATWRPAQGAHAFDDGLALAGELAQAERVLFLTDRPPPGTPAPNVEWIAVGEPLDNLALAEVVRTRDAVQLTVQSFAPAEERADLRIYVLDPESGRPQLELARESFMVPGGQRVTRTYELAGATAFDPATALLRATLEPDALALDNEVHIAPPAARTLALGTGFNAVTSAQLGLASSAEAPAPYLDRIASVVPDSVGVGTPKEAHLWLGAAAIETSAWELLVARGTGSTAFVGPFLIAAGDPLVRGLTLQGVVWRASPDLALPGRPLISAGDLPLATLDGNTLWLNLVPEGSTLTLSPDWPILLSNLAEERRRVLPGLERSNVRLGEDVVVHVEEREALQLTPRFLADAPAPEALETISTRRVVWPAPAVPGLYVLTRESRPLRANGPSATTVEGGAIAAADSGAEDRPSTPDEADLAKDPAPAWLAVNLLGGPESDLRDAASGARESDANSALARTEPNHTAALMALAALLALLLDGLFVTGRIGGGA